MNASINVWKLFAFDRNTWSYNCLQMIIAEIFCLKKISIKVGIVLDSKAKIQTITIG